MSMITGAEAETIAATVLDRTRRLLAATVTAEADTLDSLLAEGFTFTHATTGRTDSRSEWLESFRTGGRRYHVWEVYEPFVRVFPGAAVMTGRGHQEMSPRGERIELNTAFLNVWVLVDGDWKLAAWQATRLAT